MKFGTSDSRPTSWIALLEERAARAASSRACTFLLDGEQQARTLTYGELDAAARAVAARLLARAKPSGRALLLLPPGPDFVVGFFGCLYAGLAAVPVPLPTRRRGLPRLAAIVRDCQPEVVLADAALDALLGGAQRDVEVAMLSTLPRLTVESLGAEEAAAYRPPDLRTDAVALLQYTSGSTGTPKGVMLSHAHLLENERAIQRAFAHDAESVVVGWLPPFHDMGLIGNVLQPIYVGAESVHMAPAHFLVKPWRWLAAISRFRATTSGGPNFAYDLCVQKITEAQAAELDLSSWRVAFNGAEPVRSETLARFAQRFARAGFDRRAFYPCYGLAEATLLVSGGEAGGGHREHLLDRALLEEGRARAPGEGAQAALAVVG